MLTRDFKQKTANIYIQKLLARRCRCPPLRAAFTPPPPLLPRISPMSPPRSRTRPPDYRAFPDISISFLAEVPAEISDLWHRLPGLSGYWDLFLFYSPRSPPRFRTCRPDCRAFQDIGSCCYSPRSLPRSRNRRPERRASQDSRFFLLAEVHAEISGPSRRLPGPLRVSVDLFVFTRRGPRRDLGPVAPIAGPFASWLTERGPLRTRLLSESKDNTAHSKIFCFAVEVFFVLSDAVVRNF